MEVTAEQLRKLELEALERQKESEKEYPLKNIEPDSAYQKAKKEGRVDYAK